MARQKQTYDTQVKYPFSILYEKILEDRNAKSLSDKDVGILCDVSERQVRNAKESDMDFYMMDRFCTGYGWHPRQVYGNQYITPESLFAVDLSEHKITYDDLAEMIKGTFWQDQYMMRLHAWRCFVNTICS